jgi:peptidoglycan/LPS O-acetylase OafA/YrhL
MSIPRNNNFDLIRLLAAAQVVLGHASLLLPQHPGVLVEHTMQWLSYFPGVPIFFTVSGFLIFWSFERNANNIGQFFKNRGLRIYPALWISFAVTIALLLSFRAISVSTFGNLDFLGWMLRQVTFFQFGTPDILRHWGDGQVNRSLWTISVELQFYALLPFIYFLLRRFGTRWGIGWAILFFGSIAVYALLRQLPSDNIVRRLTPLCVVSVLFNFLIGIAFYKWWNQLRWFVQNRFFYWLIAYLAFIVVFGKWLGWYHPWPYSPEPIRVVGYLLLSTLTVSLAFSFHTLSEKLLKGYDISYGLYIYHGLVLNCFLLLGWTGTSVWIPAAMLAVSCFIALLSWVLVERPALRLKSRKLRTSPVVDPQVEENAAVPPAGLT